MKFLSNLFLPTSSFGNTTFGQCINLNFDDINTLTSVCQFISRKPWGHGFDVLRNRYYHVIKIEKCILFFLFFLFPFYIKCQSYRIFHLANLQSGVIISFDDTFVDDWYALNDTLQPYDWRATFFVSKFNQLSATQIQKLKDLKNAGHEIAGHGLNHENAPIYILKSGISEYFNQEIYPMINLMNNNDLSPTSFAYPGGARNPITDSLLLNEFQIIRGTTYSTSAAVSQDCYYKNNRIILGLGIDNCYPHFNMLYFISLLKYAKDNNKIVVFYAHRPVPHYHNRYETEYNTLIEICNYVKKNNMKFYTASELYNL